METRKRFLPVAACVPILALGAFGGAISSESYATAYSQGIALIFPAGTGGALSGNTASFYFTGVEVFLNSTNASGNIFEGCAPSTPIGNGLTGCPTSRGANLYTDGTNVTNGGANVNNTGNTQSYSGTSTGTVAGLDATGSFSASVASPAAGQFGYLNDYSTSNESLIVAADATHPAGSTGSLVLTYTIVRPTVTGIASGGNAFWYGTWNFSSWLSTGTTSTNDFQQGGVDLSTIAGSTQEQFIVPFVFGTASVIRVGYDVGIGWTATGGSPLSASGGFDPLQSLTSIQVLDASNAPLGNYSLTDSSGNQFGPNGVTPEPSTYALFVIGFFTMVLARRFRLV
jgi:hypothetical protein